MIEHGNDILAHIEKHQKQFNELTQELILRIINNKLHVEDNGNGATTKNTTAAEPPLLDVKLNPERFMEQQAKFLQKQRDLWEHAGRLMLGETVDPVIEEARGDSRFKDEDWASNPFYSYIKQTYLLNARYTQELVDSFEFSNKRDAEKVRFFTRQYINAMSPTNYLFTNPEVCREILKTDGRNLAQGVDNFIKDLKKSPADALKITQVDESAFTLGESLAYTPGDIVYQNDLLQLIRYHAQSDTQYSVPLLIVPPFINKYYILDLDEKKSLVNYLVGQGFCVYMISWVNPDASLAQKSFSDYVEEGVIQAVKQVLAIEHVDRLNAAGYCIGGTVLGMAQAYLEAKGESPIQSMSLLTTLFDFSEPGEVGNYISEEVFPAIEQSAELKGYFDGRVLGLSFSLLRENNLFWSFYIENYLKGKDPTPFDILYWNSDSTNIPAKVFTYYLRNMYLENKLVEGAALELLGTGIDLGNVSTPTYCLAAMADHIVLWQSAFKSAAHLSGKVRYVLTESGHVAGVVNPASKNKYPHWVNDDVSIDVNSAEPDIEQWLSSAKQIKSSWWNDWHDWLQQYSGERREVKALANDTPNLGKAPGAYVKRRIDTPKQTL